MAKKNRQKKATRLAKKSGLTPGTGIRAKHSDVISSTRTGRLKRSRVGTEKGLSDEESSHDSSDEEEQTPAKKAASAKKKMGVDEFLSGGFLQQLENDSDASSDSAGSDDELASGDESEESAEKQPAKKDKKSGVKAQKSKGKKKTDGPGSSSLDASIESHKKELEALKEKDPEFFKFLEENDAGLLDFGDDGDDSESDDSDDGEDAIGGDDDEDEKPAKTKGDEKTGRLILTAAMLDQWEPAALKGSKPAVKRILRAFRSACRTTERLEGDSASARQEDYEIPSSDLFHRVMQFSVANMGSIFDTLVGYNRVPLNVSDKQARSTIPLPNQNAKFKACAPLIKSFLANLITFMQDISEPEMIAFLLRATGDSLLPYVITNPVLSRKFLKFLVNVWTTSAESTRVQAFLVVRKLAMNAPYPFIDNCIKAIYLGYVRNAKFTNAKTYPAITFMANCVTELMGIDLGVAYQHAFSYIRQLAIHLRNAINAKSKEAHANVYSWQFVNSLKVWVQVLSRYADRGELQPLVYPLSQVILGTIQLVPTTRYFPLRFQCARMLNDISRATKMYVPIAPVLLEVLDSAELKRKPKPSTAKPLILSLALKASDSVITTPSYHTSIVKEALDILLDHFAIYAYSITYPELILPTVVLLKSKLSTVKAPKLKKEISNFVERLKRNEVYILNKRSGIEFAPKDLAEVQSFEQPGGKGTGNGVAPLLQYHTVQQGIKESAKRPMNFDDSDSEDSDNDAAQGKKKKQKLADKKKKAAEEARAKKNAGKTTAETVTPASNEQAGDDEVFEMDPDEMSSDSEAEGSGSSPGGSSSS